VELAIDTATDTASVAVSRQGVPVAETSWHAGQNHTVNLMPNALHLLALAGGEMNKIEAVFVALGPGSYNGLRAGLSAAKGLAFSLNIPLAGIGTLEIEAYPYADTGLPICVIQNAGRGEIAAATYRMSDTGWRKLIDENITTLDALCNAIDTKTIVCGQFAAFPENQPEPARFITERLGDLAIIRENTLRHAGILAELGWKKLQRGEADDIATLQPLYLRRPSITKPREKKR
jgi:tRNA threonylcarbamoyl adenosine modification protein YeaZ